MSDYYDTRGQLWQWGFYNYYYAFDIQAWNAGTSFFRPQLRRLRGLQPVLGT